MNQEEDTAKICLAKIELEKILGKKITSLDISDLVKAHEKGCVECEGVNKNCDYYKSQYLIKKLS